MITHLEPDILECEIKWTLGSITTKKASGGDGIPIELFQILKDDAVKVLHSICQQIWKIHQWPQDWKRSVFIPIPKKGNVKEGSNYHTIALISYASKLMLKILQARFQLYMNCELADVQAGFRKGKRTRDRFGSWKKQKSSRKTSPSALSITPKPLIHCVDHNKLWKILSRDGNSRPPDLPPEKSVCQSRSNSYNWTWNNRLVLNQDGVCQGCILSPY